MLICQAVTLPVKRLATKAEILKGLFGQHRDLHAADLETSGDTKGSWLALRGQ